MCFTQGFKKWDLEKIKYSMGTGVYWAKSGKNQEKHWPA